MNVLSEFYADSSSRNEDMSPEKVKNVNLLDAKKGRDYQNLPMAIHSVVVETFVERQTN